MNVKLFDFEHEADLEDAINDYIEGKNIIDIKYQVSNFSSNGEQIYSFSCLIIYEK